MWIFASDMSCSRILTATSVSDLGLMPVALVCCRAADHPILLVGTTMGVGSETLDMMPYLAVLQASSKVCRFLLQVLYSSVMARTYGFILAQSLLFFFLSS